MNGPEHYLKAEDHLTDAVTMDEEPEVSAWHQRQAQVHATLALAAAFVDGPAVMRPEERDEWDRATGRHAEKSSLIGRTVANTYDDSPCPTTGEVVGQIDEETLEVLWDGEDEPMIEPFDGLRPVDELTGGAS